MRGYGRSTVYDKHSDYAMEHVVDDMMDLIAHIGRESAVWVGHDWGAPVVWSVASHHPSRCQGVAALCVPYLPAGFAPSTLIPLIDRDVYPEGEFPAGQWDYQLFYEEHFEKASRTFEANVGNTVKCLFRSGDPSRQGKPGALASVRQNGGWFGGKSEAPDAPLDRGVLTEEDFLQYTCALERNGFFGPDSWYMNAGRNLQFAKSAVNGGRLTMPALFLHAAYDYTCETIRSKLTDPMRQHCDRLTEVTVPSGHWMAQERPTEVNSALVKWLALNVPTMWRS
jgi:pimeloyl-ACP methyl ester carboxylesterase